MERELEISEYFRTITGRRDSFEVKGAPTADLPRYIAGLYELRNATVLQIPVILAMLKPTAIPSAIELGRHYELLKTRVGTEVIFTGAITKRTAERLIRRHIPHIVVGRQLYLPFLLLEIKSANSSDALDLPEHTKLSQWSEVLVIRQLLRRDLGGMAGADIARVTGMSKMTAQRAVNQLSAAKLCRVEEQGRRKVLHFDDIARLWSETSKILAPPLSMSLTLATLPKELPTFISGTSALARSTLLTEDDLPVFAASRRLYSRIGGPRLSAGDQAKCRLELWDRDPSLTATDGVVDPISLYLNMRYGDDRVRIALIELLRQHNLGEPT